MRKKKPKERSISKTASKESRRITKTPKMPDFRSINSVTGQINNIKVFYI